MSISLEQRMVQHIQDVFQKDVMHGLSGATLTAPGYPSYSVSFATMP